MTFIKLTARQMNVLKNAAGLPRVYGGFISLRLARFIASKYRKQILSVIGKKTEMEYQELGILPYT